MAEDTQVSLVALVASGVEAAGDEAHGGQALMAEGAFGPMGAPAQLPEPVSAEV